MTNPIHNLNKAFESRVRLGIMSALVVNDALDFNALKETLDLTDGNLSAHIAVLEKNNYISVKKEFHGKKPLTTYAATAKGRKAFAEHLDALEQLIKSSQ